MASRRVSSLKRIGNGNAMHLDVQDMRNFYYRSPLGRVVQTALRRHIAQLWTNTKGQTVVGYGFAVPLLRPFVDTSRRVVGLMPAPQGVMPWPPRAPNLSVLCEETRWPLETGHVDRLVVLHGLETSEQPSALLEECARVLGPGGRALFIVPNRVSLWARQERTPFGFGRPYTLGQLESQLRKHGFLPENHRAALYQPPSMSRFWMKSAPVWERIGQSMGTVMAGGVLMVEASKRVQTTNGTPIGRVVRDSLGALSPEGEAKLAWASGKHPRR